MKVKTSITLSEESLQALDQLQEFANRSQAIEMAVQTYLNLRAKQRRNRKDLKLLNKHHHRFNAEAAEVLSYQIPI